MNIESMFCSIVFGAIVGCALAKVLAHKRRQRKIDEARRKAVEYGIRNNLPIGGFFGHQIQKKPDWYRYPGEY